MRRQRRKQREKTEERVVSEKFEHERRRDPLRALNDKQAHYIAALMTSDQVIVTGCAGTGKTFIAATVAADLYLNQNINKIVLTRPNIGAGKSLGYFKGTMEEKIAPWVVPFTDVIEARLTPPVYTAAVNKRNIEVVPFEVMRGRTFDNAFIILDEAQNTSVHEIKMFLTRVGKNSRVVINGDISQSDIKGSGSGLEKVSQLVRKHQLDVPMIEFTEDDIVRSDVCAMWIKVFSREGL